MPKIPLKGLFGLKGKSKPKNPSSGYGPPRAPPVSPSYGVPAAPPINSGYTVPSYGGSSTGVTVPQGPPRPSYSGGGGSSASSSSQYGPSNAIRMLPSPNLATGRPPVSF